MEQWSTPCCKSQSLRNGCSTLQRMAKLTGTWVRGWMHIRMEMLRASKGLWQKHSWKGKHNLFSCCYVILTNSSNCRRTRTWNVWIFQTSLVPKMGRALGNIAVVGWACQDDKDEITENHENPKGECWEYSCISCSRCVSKGRDLVGVNAG